MKRHIMRSLMTSGALVLLAPLLSGCVGLLIEMPSNENIQSPVPLLGVTDNRWACQRTTPSATKSDYLGAWGEPRKKIATDKGETWSYGEDWRWCGFWIFAVGPIPFMLPICETFDHVEFEGDIAVRSASRRIVGSGAGIFFYPNPYTLVLPIPFIFEPGPPIIPGRLLQMRMAGDPPKYSPCGPPQIPAQPESSKLPGPTDDFVNCVAGGERRWTYRSKCD